MDRSCVMTLSFKACCFAVISVVVMLFTQVTGNLVVAPANRVTLVGQSVQFDCSTDDTLSVSWLHFPIGSRTPRDVYISRTVVSPYSPRFTVHIVKGIIQKRSLGNGITAYNLLITGVRLEDAGTYRCVDRTGMGEQRSAELTVLGSLPKCNTNIEPDGFIYENDCHNPIEKIHCSCSIEYAGNVPEMQWKTASGQDTIHAQSLTNVSEKTVSSELNITATKSMDGALVIWHSTQSPQLKWTSAPIKLLYAKHNLSPLILSQSESVTCAANSSQHCSYTWIVKTNTDNELQKIERQTLEVNQPGIYLCEANCPFHDTPCTVLAMHVEYRNAVEHEYTSSVLIAFLVIAILVALVLGIGLWRVWVVKSRSIRKLERKLANLSNLPPSSKSNSSSSQAHLIDKSRSHYLRQNSNVTSSSSSNGSSQLGSDEKEPCMNVKSNGICNSSAPPPA